jgi:hypothetical protein
MCLRISSIDDMRRMTHRGAGVAANSSRLSVCVRRRAVASNDVSILLRAETVGLHFSADFDFAIVQQSSGRLSHTRLRFCIAKRACASPTCGGCTSMRSACAMRTARSQISRVGYLSRDGAGCHLHRRRAPRDRGRPRTRASNSLYDDHRTTCSSARRAFGHAPTSVPFALWHRPCSRQAARRIRS